MTVRAQDQMERLCLALPMLDEDTTVALADLAERVGTSEQTLLDDLRALNTSDRDVAGFVESVELFLGPDGVGKRSAHFHRPPRLTRSELAALDLGLGMLLLERPPEERATVAAARDKVRMASAAPSASAGASTSGMAVEAVPPALQETFAVLWQAREDRQAVRLAYQRASAANAQERVVHPWAVVRVHQHIYVIGWCTTVTDVRVFRLDRIASAVAEPTVFDVPTDFNLDTIVRDGHIFSGELPDDELVVRYAPRIARWITEREQCVVEHDGSVIVHWPLADDDWAVRHVLQYGMDAQVLEPARIRDQVRARLASLLQRTTDSGAAIR